MTASILLFKLPALCKFIVPVLIATIFEATCASVAYLSCIHISFFLVKRFLEQAKEEFLQKWDTPSKVNCLFVCLFICLYVCLFIYLFVCLPIQLFN